MDKEKQENLKLLYLLMYYAPLNQTGTFRNLRFSKYLGRLGFKQYIFTGKYKTDINLKLNESTPPDAIIYRKKINVSQFKWTNRQKIKNTLQSKLIYNIKDIFFSPDKYIWWVLSYLPKMIYTIKKEKIKLVMTTGPCFSPFIGAFLLKKICKVKIILDYRDPWTNGWIQQSQGFIYKSIISFWERQCVLNCDLITTCTAEMQEYLQTKYQPKCTLLIISNGFDLDDFKINNTSPILFKKDLFYFVYTGKFDILDKVYNPQNLLTAFDIFTKKLTHSNCQLLLIGSTTAQTINYIKTLKNNNITTLDPMSKQNISQIQKNADVLIHFYYPIAPTDTISFKICEYAICKKPIISFSIKEGALYNLLKDKKIGETANTNNVEEIAALFHKAYKGEIDLCDNPEMQLKEYNVEYTTSILANELKRLNTE